MKLFLSIISGTVFMLAGLNPLFGFNLLKNKISPDKGTIYSFGVNYTYDNAGSSWNHASVYRHLGYHYHPVSKQVDCDFKQHYNKRHYHHKPHGDHLWHSSRHQTHHILNRFKKGYECQFQR